MDEPETKLCANCNREIPASNFTIHSVHCARNIKVCAVCKEPMPTAELDEHHKKYHQLLPCKKCGESVAGTDLEDHVRDSCALTIQTCRYCSLELPRRALPAHEGYCGARTELCADCGEYVMIKYRQVHQDTNHGFLRLDDDPVPQPQPRNDPPNPSSSTSQASASTRPKQTNVESAENRRTNTQPNTPRQNQPSNDRQFDSFNGLETTILRPNHQGFIVGFGGPGISIGVGGPLPTINNNRGVRYSSTQIFRLKRMNDEPQINTAVAGTSKVNKNLPMSLRGGAGAVKKRPAPPPPPSPLRDLPYHSALQRAQREERARQEQSAINVAMGLPPVLSAAEKVERLRKMDAFHNREDQPVDYRSRLQGRVWMNHTNIPTGHVLGSQSSQDGYVDNRPSFSGGGDGPRNATVQAQAQNQALNQEQAGSHDSSQEDRRNDFRDLKPMSPEEFRNRFQQLQVTGEGTAGARAGGQGGDRFSEIKSSLRELRRGLNEVTAPYNANNINNAPANQGSDDQGNRVNRARSPSPDQLEAMDNEDDFIYDDDDDYMEDDDVEIPCEFCGALIAFDELVLHQTGCRPDLAQYVSPPPPPPPRPPPPHPPAEGDAGEGAEADVNLAPVIPCEFCARSLPVYLITEHQEQCRREAELLYPD